MLHKYKDQILTAAIILLVALAAFQLGRLSQDWGRGSDFKVIEGV